MGERPFMQLYVSDYLGDTRELSCEQHGAYLLLLMTMWNAGGSLPDDDVKLSRIVCLSLKKWKAMRPHVELFFSIGNGIWENDRLTKERQKSESKTQSRASAGAKGGAAKALKYNNLSLANATVLPKHLPDTISHIEAATQLGDGKMVYDRLIEAASSRGQCHQNLAMGIAPITDLIGKGYTLESDVLPVIREKAAPSIRSWSYFVTIIIQRHADKQAIPAKPKAKAINWRERVSAFYDEGLWPMGWGPRPGDPGCGAPAELIRS